MSGLLHDAHQALLADPAALACLAKLRGWTVEAARALGLGLDRGRVVIPVMGSDLSIRGVLRYQPNAELLDGAPKMMAAPGTPRELFPPIEAIEDSTVWLVEGEPDAISATSVGLPAVGVPGSASWRSEWAERFAGRDVIVCCDCDGPGRGLAARAADDLIEHAAMVRVVDLAPARDDGHDIGSLVAEAGPGEHAQVRTLLQAVAQRASAHLRVEDRPPRPRLEVADLRRALRDALSGRNQGAAAWPIPFPTIRDFTDGGIRPGEVWVIAGWTSHGKSIVADMVLDTVAASGARAHLYATEMTLVQRGFRAIARRSGLLSASALRRHHPDKPTLNAGELEIAQHQVEELRWGMTPVRDWTPRHVALDIVASRTQVAVVDHLHDFHYRDERELARHVGEFTAAVGSDAAGLHGGSAVVLLCQLNESQMRDSRSGQLPRPGLHSLKGASAIKQKADVVMFVWLDTDEDGLPNEGPDGVEGELWVAKGRNGGVGARQHVRLDTKTLTLRERWL